ncbi:hypothetical protein HNR00_003579 [Methylorubrum rhodinum]|uniref:DUF4402 domain-containing protein n=1 Tax=Methylorubrum rhodinum TaxID=29428 RepID=A0A840ZL64_9HYPH|nr:hypothetical protein [Methylorubrum rhodinum]MBB5758852.1 hypothetical protein [Methylorubrum rhodinum]
MRTLLAGAIALLALTIGALAQSPAILRPPGGLALDGGTKTTTATAGAATLNKLSGKITSEALTTAAGATYTLTLTNSTVAAGDIVFASLANGTNTTGSPGVVRVAPGASSVTITVRNGDAAAALNGTVVVSFMVLKN